MSSNKTRGKNETKAPGLKHGSNFVFSFQRKKAFNRQKESQSKKNRFTGIIGTAINFK